MKLFWRKNSDQNYINSIEAGQRPNTAPPRGMPCGHNVFDVHPGKEHRGNDGGTLRRCTQLGICYTVPMNIEFNGKIWFWKGPAPWYFVTVPAKQSRDLKAISGFVTYGWGVIPVHVRIGKTDWQTSLFPKDSRYIVPIKASVRKAENLEEGDNVTVRLEVR
jgi:hypothetical protein